MINNPTMINPYPVVEQATPSITVSTSGLITSTASQSAGLVNAGSKSATKQLTTKAATTITPGTSSKTAISSQTFATGNITVAGDSNLIASNIKSGVSIFGVNGSLAITEVYNRFRLTGDNSSNSPILKIPVKANPVFVAVISTTFDSSRYTGNYNVMLNYVAYRGISTTPNSATIIYWNATTKNLSYGTGYNSEAFFTYSNDQISIDVSTFLNSATNAVWYTYVNNVVIAYQASAL